MRKLTWRLVVLAVLGAWVAGAPADVTYPARIGQTEFIADTADLITPGDEAAIRARCAQLLDERGIPLIVVTITAMADYGAAGWPIERYAMNLFDEWGIGAGDRSAGILLLVSKNDRKLRIELGSGWSRDRDALAASIVNGTIVPRFKAEQFSDGIRRGVESLASRLGGQAAVAPIQAAPSNTIAPPPRSHTPTPVSAPPAAPYRAPAVGFGGLGILGPFVCIFAAVVIVILAVVLGRWGGSSGLGRGGMLGGGLGGSMGGYGPYGGGGGGGWGGFWPGFMMGQWMGGSSHGSRHDSGGSSGGGIFGGGGGGLGGFGGGGGGGFGGFSGGGGGSFGGGFSGGGGASGSW